MHRLLGQHGQHLFRAVSRSVRIRGYSTSVRLEEAFWSVLDAIADREGTTTGKLVAALYEEALELHDGQARKPNIASTLRTLCLLTQMHLGTSDHRD